MPSVEETLCAAIAERRLITFTLDRRLRIAEPHDYGVMNGTRRLFFYQIGGETRSQQPLGWRWAALPEISQLSVLDERFAGPRPTPSGKHHRWDTLIASVSRAVTQPPATPRGRRTKTEPPGEVMTHFPKLLRGLPRFDGPFDAFKLEAKDCDVLFASYPAGTVIPPHSHETENVGVITQGELILIVDGRELRYRPGDWYHVPARVTHAARFDTETSEIEFWFHRT